MNTNPLDTHENKQAHREWLVRTYKPERLFGRGNEYAEGLIQHRWEDFLEDGCDWTSPYDTVTGRTECFGKKPDWWIQEWNGNMKTGKAV